MRSIFLLVVLWMSVTVVPAQDKNVQDKIQEKYGKGKIYAGIRLADKHLSGKDPDMSVLVLRADGLNRIGRYLNAEIDARKAIHSGNGELLKPAAAQLGVAYMETGRSDSARYWLETSLGSGNDSEALIRLGRMDAIQGDHKKALIRFDQVLKDSPGNVRALMDRGAAYSIIGDTAAAKADLDRAVELSPRDPVAWNSRGFHVHAAQGRHLQAIEDYDRAIKFDPNYSFAFNNRGWSYYKLGNVKKARKNIRAAGKKRAGNPFVYRNLGVIDLETGDTAKACIQFERALALNFTQLHGDEVSELIKKHCGRSPEEKPGAKPLSNAPATPPVRSNAPRSNAP
ncbi:MAG: tetratricopeptide repeat protein [Bacteroidota bacterium]|nr:tetratricopeptide repeat protein [Bacteroidota bacterium]